MEAELQIRPIFSASQQQLLFITRCLVVLINISIFTVTRPLEREKEQAVVPDAQYAAEPFLTVRIPHFWLNIKPVVKGLNQTNDVTSEREWQKAVRTSRKIHPHLH